MENAELFHERLAKVGTDKTPEAGLCARPGCLEPGDFRAPRSRQLDSGFFHFCLEHVREYNRAWNFFSGMSRDDIERFQQEVATWHRPTWRFGLNRSDIRPELDDPFELFSDQGSGGIAPKNRASEWSARQRSALTEMELDATANLQDIKQRYKQLVKRYHPDRNGGDAEAEERLKVIIKSYHILISRGS